MSPVESMTAGDPVIGVAEGGLRETIIDGETGIPLPPGFQPRILPMPSGSCRCPGRPPCEARAGLSSEEPFIAGCAPSSWGAAHNMQIP